MTPDPSKTRLALEFAFGPRAATVVSVVDTLTGIASTVVSALREEVAMRLDPDSRALLNDAEACVSWNESLRARVAELEAALAAEKAEAAIASKPAPFPWSDEAVERATLAAVDERDRLHDDECEWVATEFDASLRIMRAALATLAPPPQAVTLDVKGLAAKAVTVARSGLNCVDVSVIGEKVSSAATMARAEKEAERLRDILVSLAPQAAPPKLDDTLEGHVVLSLSHLLKDGDDKTAKQLVSMAAETLSRPVGVGDVWGDAVRVEHDEGDAHIIVGSERRGPFAPRHYAEETAAWIRRGLASLPPLRAVLPGGVTDAMVEAYRQAWEARFEASDDDVTMDECKVAGLAAAIDAANIRVLGPDERVVRMRTVTAEETLPVGKLFLYRSNRAEAGWELFRSRSLDRVGDGTLVHLSDLDAPKEAPDGQ